MAALAFARGLSSDVRAVHIASDREVAKTLRRTWRQYVTDVPLEIVISPHQSVIGDFLKYLDGIQERGHRRISVVIPQIVPRHWWEMLLDSQTAWMLRMALVLRKQIPVISVRYHLRRC